MTPRSIASNQMRSLLLAVLASCSFSAAHAQTAVPDSGPIKIGSLWKDAERLFAIAGIERTKNYDAHGYIPRKSPSDPPPPKEFYFQLDDQIRLEVIVGHESQRIEKLNARFYPATPFANRHFDFRCGGIELHRDRSYSLRFLPTKPHANDGK